MPPWVPEESWSGQDVFIIGGGNSLRESHFDWNLLKPERTIGVNDAYLLGPEICKVCFFSDARFWKANEKALAKFAGLVFTCYPQLYKTKIPWLWTIHRENQGLWHKSVGFNGNTGATAINLAFLFGAMRVFLLGFDMKLVAGKPHWHDNLLTKQSLNPTTYQDFVRRFRFLVRDWKLKFPDRQIINLTKDSGLPAHMIPWKDPDEFWAERVSSRLVQAGVKNG